MRIQHTLIAMALAFSVNGFADHHEGGEMKGQKFEEAKAMVLENLKKRKTHLAEMETCVSAATDKEGLKTCRSKHQEAMKEHREMNKDMREKRRAERKGQKEG